MRKQNLLFAFILITACFALWGFANDITNPMVKAFSKIFRTSVTEGSLVQVAFYGGYFAMAVPAAIFIRRYSYKAGVLMGLALYASGAFLFFPAMVTGNFYPFLIAYFILTCGLSFLETSCNPYILALGPKETAIRRLNLAQAFNPIGSLCGMYVAMNFIQNRLDPLSTEERMNLSPKAFEAVKEHDLGVLIGPYLWIGLVICIILVLIYITKMPMGGDEGGSSKGIMGRLWRDKEYRYGVIAQFFYVGVQIMCWTFIIQYGTRIFMAEGMDEQAAEVLSQKYNIVAMAIFCASRFISTAVMKYVKAPVMLTIFGIGGAIATCGVIAFQDIRGLYCLVAVSAFMSLMFPTIYGMALEKLDLNDAKFGAAGLIMAILGGSVLPPVQALIIDQPVVAGIPGVNASFVLPLACFIIIIFYAASCAKNRA